MKDLIFFTDRYPFKNGEPYIESEIGILSKKFNRIFVLPCSLAVDISLAVSVPHNVHVLQPAVTEDIFNGSASIVQKIKWSLKHILLWYIACLITPIFYKELMYCAKTSSISISKINRIFRTLAPSIRNTYRYKKLLKNESFDEVIAYSYWIEPTILFANSIISSGRIVRSVSRTHGWDLFSERNSDNYLAFQQAIVDKIDILSLISENGKQYISNKYPEYVNKYKISRLGTTDYGLQEYNHSTMFTVASCSSIIPLKRVDRIIEGVGLLQSKLGSQIKVKWIHFGDGYEAEKIKKYANSKLNGMVDYTFAGKVTNNDLMTYYKNNSIDLFVNLSTAEGLPVSIMEAMSFGIPVVATNVGGTREIVENGYNGFLLDSEFTNAEFAEACEQIAENIVDVNTFRVNARTIWERYYNNYKNYTDFCSNILNV